MQNEELFQKITVSQVKFMKRTVFSLDSFHDVSNDFKEKLAPKTKSNCSSAVVTAGEADECPIMDAWSNIAQRLEEKKKGVVGTLKNLLMVHWQGASLSLFIFYAIVYFSPDWN